MEILFGADSTYINPSFQYIYIYKNVRVRCLVAHFIRLNLAPREWITHHHDAIRINVILITLFQTCREDRKVKVNYNKHNATRKTLMKRAMIGCANDDMAFVRLLNEYVNSLWMGYKAYV